MLLGLLLATFSALPSPILPAPLGGEAVEDLRVQTSDGLALAARFYAPPASSKTKASGVLLVHPAGAEKGGLDDLARYLQHRGFGVLALDLRGHGESAGATCDWKALDAVGREACWDAAVRDLEAARSLLRARSELQSNNWSIVGVGSGAELAVRHAQTDATVSALVLIDTAADFLGERIVADLGRLAGLPTLVVASKDRRDEATRLQRGAQRAGAKAPGVELEIVKAEPSGLLSDAGMRAVLAAWLREKLQPRR